MLSFNSQNYVVEYKKATPQQWRGEAAKDNRLERVFGLFREPDEVNAIGSAMDLVSNLYSGQCEKDYDRRQILFYNEYGELDGVFYDFCATPESEWSEQPEEDAIQTWWTKNSDDTLTFHQKNSFFHGEGLKVPVPDGYHYEQYGNGENQGWAYIVPQDVSLYANHIDAKPYSFGLTSSPVSHIAFEAKNIEAYKQVFLSAGHLTSGVLVDSFTVSDHCAFLYQNWYDTADKTYNKINGFLFAGNDVYQFHIYVNHTAPIGHDEDTISAFLEVGRAWMRQLALRADQGNSTYVAATTHTVPKETSAEPFQLSDDGKTLIAYTGKEKNVVVPQSVSIVSERAFYKSKATSVTLQNGVETIGEMAFASSNLKSITLPDSLKEIGAYAFSRCKKLTQINLPSGDTTVGEHAFWKCESLTSITWPGTIKVLPRAAFDCCTSLETVTIEEGVTEIGHSAFFFSDNLKDLYLPESLYKIDSCALPLLGKPTLHVYQDSYAEKYAKENNLPTMILLTPEQEAEKKRQEEARRIAEEKYTAELKAWEQTCGEIRAQREHRVSELLEEKRTSLQNEAQSKYNAAVTAANKRKEAVQQKKADAEMRLSTLGIFKFAEKKAAKAAIEEAVGEIQAAEAALVIAKQTLDKELAAIPATINSRRYMVSKEVEHEYPLPAKPEKPL